MQACYARQSIDKKDSISIETQIELAKKECIPEEDIEEYRDKGYSGKNTRRPEWQRMMRDVQEGKISRIIVYRIDRFSRSLLDFSNAWEIMKDHNVDFISVNEKFDTSTPIGKAMLFILMVFAQLERETIAERVADNYYARTKLGNWPGGPAPYGFQNGLIEIAGNKCPTLIENDLM
ncbi:MAG: recombinase family protein, partial [Lachnospiraceae bacterium]|nr:recombinase family protein [Lachnospiraceae bacterium]